jgi:2-dehydro-3-deoxyglucarate aldolase/4-hydroxy-2-oxoheptanedioate aldolase
MTRSELVELMGSGRPALGTFVNLGSPLAVEACALGGVDWVLIDLEHGGAGEEALLPQILAAEARGVAPLVRVETADRIRAGRVLDVGALGVMFPRIDTAQQATDAITHLRYPPQGDRGVATYNRACGFGLDIGALDRANDEILGIIQIESPEAVANAAAIAAVPGVDVLFVGPRDLSHAMGIPGQVGHPDFLAALGQVLDAARDAGIAAGTLAATPASAAGYVAAGFTFVGVGSDSSILAGAVADAIRATIDAAAEDATRRQKEIA